MKIDIHYIARVEGEGSVKFEIMNGKLGNLMLNIWEPPRFFEGFLVGRKYDEVPDIVSRICGICPVSHMTTSINALEKAMGIAPSPEIKKLRTIMELSQIAASHIVHIYALVLPDYHRLDMLSGLDEEIRRLVRMKEAVNGVTALFGGRALHPVTMVVGGFTKIPPKDEIAKVIARLEEIKADALDTVGMASGLACPELQCDVEYVALVKEDEYAVNEGIIAASSGLKTDLARYYSFFEEHQVPYANAKRTTMKGKRPIMVGALSRLHMKFHSLHQEAKKAAGSAGFAPSDNNPFSNIMAQAIEVVHCISACSELLRGLDCREPFLKVTPKEGSGAAITEAPRGLLYHEYQVNKRGVIEKANLVTPTAYNFQSLEENLKKLVCENIDKSPEELSLLCEMLVRAYDPCFSCSVH